MKKRTAPRKKMKTGAFGALNNKEEQPLDEHAYDVQTFYKETGLAQSIARSEWFNGITLAVISINALYIGVEAQMNAPGQPEAAELVWIVFDHFFCLFFVLELLVRFLSFQCKKNCMKDGWFKFDLALLMLMVLETWVMPIFLLLLNTSGALPIGPMKLLRLLRLARMTRLMSRMPELLTMVKGMSMASRAVGSSLLLLGLLVYVFAIVLYMILADNDETAQSFGSLPKCMWTLLMDGTFMDSIGTQLTGLLDRREYLAVFVFMVFVGLSAMTVMNMLIGVLCEVVSAVAASEREEAAISLMKETILVLLKNVDVDKSGEISKAEMRELVKDPGALNVFDELQVNVKYLTLMQEYLLDEGSGDLSIKLIMDLILTSRGERPTMMKDLVDIHMFTCWNMHRLFDEKIRDLSGQIQRWLTPMMVAPRSNCCL